MPSEHRHSLLSRFKAALSGRRPLAPVAADLLTAILVTGLFSLVMQTGPARVLDGMVFDTITRNESPRAPRVVIVETSPVPAGQQAMSDRALIDAAAKEGIKTLGFIAIKQTDISRPGEDLPPRVVVRRKAGRVPASDAWQLDGDANPGDRIGVAPALRLPDSYGIRRQHLASIDGTTGKLPLFETLLAGRAELEGAYFVRMPRAQNIPRITARQLIEGDFAAGELDGLTAVVVSAEPAAGRAIATPLDPGGTATDSVLFSAHAVQMLLDRREVRAAGPIAAIGAIFAAAILALFLFGRPLSRLAAVVALVGGMLALGCVAWAALQALDLLLPVTAVLGAFATAAAIRLVRNVAQGEKRIEATIERAIDLAFGRNLFQDNSQLPAVFATAAQVLGLPHAALMLRDGSGTWSALQLHGASADDLTLDSPAAVKCLKQLEDARATIGAVTLAPGWSRATTAAALPDGGNLLLMLYDLPKGKDRARIRRILADGVARMRAMRHWQHRLLANQGQSASRVPLELRMQSAANLITVHGDELAKGLDALDTGVFVFRPLGIPIHANAPMLKLLDLADMAPARTTLIDAITGLTDLDSERARSMARDVLLHGEEMRVPMRELGARQRILRLGLAGDVASRAQTVLVLEAIDITELDQLAELRLAVGTFIDRQLRNDIEAISLGASLARDPRLAKPALERIVDRIADVAKRASERLEHVRDLLEDEPLTGLDPCYPIEARKVLNQAIERAIPFAQELDVSINQRLPAISGFSIAEPLMLSDMVEALLRLIIADTAQGGVVEIALDEADSETNVAISGGFGLPFDRLCAALDAGPGEVPAEYQIAAAGMAQALQWKGSVSYWSSAGGGFRFNIRLRRIG